MCIRRRYVLVSRVRTLDSLRLLQFDLEGHQALSRLKHDEYLAAWERGYDQQTGRWSDAHAVAALTELRRTRVSTRQKLAEAKRKATAVKHKLVGGASRKCAPKRVSAAAAPTAPNKRARRPATVPPA